jgi:hypothetical protein
MTFGDITGALPRNVLLFSGHMIDAPGRKDPRFPGNKEPVASAAIAKTLSHLNAGAGDLGICGGACGGDLLFAESALSRQLRLEPDKSSMPIAIGKIDGLCKKCALVKWYIEVKANAILHVAPAELGPLAPGEDPYERNNLWMLEAALRFGANKLSFICLWNGKGGDGPGGTKHLMEQVRRRAGRIYWLNTNQLWA